ncbi:MAG: TlpA family protein disulfide reductase [Planctomycetota bacterium]|nr:TlpA family protein disulfide reductase [Planctomycetota bacterium]
MKGFAIAPACAVAAAAFLTAFASATSLSAAEPPVAEEPPVTKEPPVVKEQPAGDDVASEYARLNRELSAAAPKRGASSEEIAKFVALLKEKLGGFATKRAGTKEAFDAALGLGAVLANMEDPDAKKWLQHAEKNTPANADGQAVLALHAMLARTLASGGDIEGARKSAEKVGKMMPEAAGEISKEVESAYRLRVGGTPFDIEEKDIDGKLFSLARLKGKVVLVDFWATWCPPCREEMPNVKKIYGDFHEKGFEIVGVSLDKEEEKLRAYVKENGISWPQISDFKGWNNKTVQAFNVRSIPFMLVVDRKGIIRYRNVRGEELRQAVARLIAEE